VEKKSFNQRGAPGACWVSLLPRLRSFLQGKELWRGVLKGAGCHACHGSRWRDRRDRRDRVGRSDSKVKGNKPTPFQRERTE
jgi:hypothetical protein